MGPALDTSKAAGGKQQGGPCHLDAEGNPLESVLLAPPMTVIGAQIAPSPAADGEAVRGRLTRSRLDQLPSTVGFWFAWKGFYPDTLVWKP